MTAGGEQPVCSFCGESGGPARPVTVAPDGAAICAECASRVAAIMRRAGKPPPQPHPIDPRDLRDPVVVRLGEHAVGDLGHPRVDARLVLAIALRDQEVAAWLRDRGVDEAAVRRRFSGLDLGFDPTWP